MKKSSSFIRDLNDHVVKVISIVFGLLGAVTIFVSVDDIAGEEIFPKFIILGVILLACVAIGGLYLYFDKKSKSKEIYNKGKCSITVSYNNMKDIICKPTKHKRTVVVPINTMLSITGRKDFTSEGSIHRILLEYLEENGVSLEEETLLSQSVKKVTPDECSIGDWFMVEGAKLGLEDNVRFLLVVICQLDEKHGGKYIKPVTRLQYLNCMQNMIDAICLHCGNREPVYMPLVGAGNARIAESDVLMNMMKELLLFNKDKINQEVHLVLNPKYQEETPIYNL